MNKSFVESVRNFVVHALNIHGNFDEVSSKEQGFKSQPLNYKHKLFCDLI